MSARDPAARKGYDQACTVASALDVLGDRWTLLILRELLGGPARFRELEQGLPGVAKNLLTNRLRRLEADGLVRRIESASAVQYVVTERGATVRPVVDALGMWGARHPRVSPNRHPRSARATAVALAAILGHRLASMPDDRSVVELDVDGAPIEIQLGPRPAATARPASDADARVETTAAAMADYLDGDGFDESGFRHAAGDEEATRALFRALRGD